MGRTPTPDGKRNPWSVKLSDAKSAAADAAREGMPRALWLESLIDAALDGRALRGRTGPARHQPAAAPPQPPDPAPVSREPKPADCPHRLPRGAWCKTCRRTKT